MRAPTYDNTAFDHDAEEEERMMVMRGDDGTHSTHGGSSMGRREDSDHTMQGDTTSMSMTTDQDQDVSRDIRMVHKRAFIYLCVLFEVLV